MYDEVIFFMFSNHFNKKFHQFSATWESKHYTRHPIEALASDLAAVSKILYAGGSKNTKSNGRIVYRGNNVLNKRVYFQSIIFQFRYLEEK